MSFLSGNIGAPLYKLLMTTVQDESTGNVATTSANMNINNNNNDTQINGLNKESEEEKVGKKQYRFNVEGRNIAIPLMGVATGFSISELFLIYYLLLAISRLLFNY
jgi:hypothetical protein